MNSSVRYRPLAVLVLCLMLSMFMMSSGQDPMSHGIQFLARPIQSVIIETAQGLRHAWVRYISLLGTEQTNEFLLEENSRLRQKLLALEESRMERDRLRALVSFRDMLQRPALAARIIGWDNSPYAQSILCNRGKIDGVLPNMSVATNDGLIGRVLKVGRSTSQVQILLDQLSNVASLIQRTRVPGIVTGQGSDRPLLLRYVPKSAEVRVGDQILTSGVDGLYHKGLLVGQVSRVESDSSGLFLKIEIEPSVPLERVEEVLLFEPVVEEPIQPTPKPSPSATPVQQP